MADFHFLRPLWLLSLIPLVIILWQLRRVHVKQSGWQSVIPAHLLKHLIDGQQAGRKLPLTSLAIAWLVTTIALAGPTWQRLPQPVFEAEAGKIVLMDLSLSMRATDIKPNRLSRLKYKVLDIVKALKEGDVGLVAYAGDAFIISPLTNDSKNLLALIPSLSPEIMPVKGSDPLLGIDKAAELLKQAGYPEGDIIWLTDGVNHQDMSDLRELIAESPYRLLTIGIGSADGAPIKQANGDLLKDNTGAIVVPKLDARLLQSLSQQSGGFYIDSTADDFDVQQLVTAFNKVEQIKQQDENSNQTFGDQWQEFGPWLILLILPFAAYAFRRGLIYVLAPFTLVLLPADHAWANDSNSLWQDLWQTKDQQAAEAYQQQDYQQAAELFEDQRWQAASQMKAGNYEAAAKLLDGLTDAESLYNKGNALANLGQLEQAVDAYKEALKQDPNFDKAKQNQTLAEQLLKQQQQQSENNQNQDGDSQQDGEQDQGDNSQNGDSSNSENNSQDQSQGSEQDDQQSDQQNDGSQQNQSDSEQSSKQEQQQNSQSSEQEQSDEEANQAQADKQSDEQEEQSSQQAQQLGEETDQEPEGDAEQAVMSPEERQAQEAKERLMKKLLNKVEDDPSYLLKRKMQLEHQQRKRSQQPRGVQQTW